MPTRWFDWIWVGLCFGMGFFVSQAVLHFIGALISKA